MRYYRLDLTEAATGKTWGGWTSHPNGIMAAPDRGALNVEFDLQVAPYSGLSVGTAGGDLGQSVIRIWGVPIALIGQASNFSSPLGAPLFNFTLYGGMGKGLPLATPSQAGALMTGSVWRTIGNWIGTEMTLDLYLAAPAPTTAASAGNSGTPAAPAVPFVLNWPQGTPLATALKTALQQAYPGAAVQILISPNLVATKGEAGIYGSLGELADFVNRRSVAMLGANNPLYSGVQITARNGGFVVYDNSGTTDASNTAATGGTAPNAVKTTQIQFTDLIGQPTWVGFNQISFATVMRADVTIGDYITMPPSVVTVTAQGAANTPGGFSQGRWSSAVAGTWQVQKIRHIGNYKAPRGEAWVSTYFAFQIPPGNGAPAANTIGAAVS